MNEVIAGIVTYNPDINRLCKNLDAIKNQVSCIVIVDNASINIEEIKNLINNYKVTLIENESNKGIACGLNQCMQFAEENQYEWVITLDQDSICPSDIIDKSRILLNKNDIAMIVPLIKESSSGEICYLGDRINGEDFQEVKKCITSASITNVNAWKVVGKFDEKLFIDYVDYDFAMKVILNDYKIVRMNKVILDHQIGSSEYKLFLKWKVRVANHSEFRKYYIARNMVIYIKTYWKNINVFKELMRLTKVLLLIIFFENNKRKKIKTYFKGIKDGVQYKES